MKISWHRYQLAYKHPFALAAGTRTHTPSIVVKIQQGNFIGYGEATLPPYLPETQDSVVQFISSISLKSIHSLPDFEYAVAHIQNRAGNYFAKAALDIALHDLWARINNVSVSQLLGFSNEPIPYCTHTIGMDAPDKIAEKVKEAEAFMMLKVKLGGQHDKEMIEIIRGVTPKPLCVDANQGWEKKDEALEMIEWLAGKNVLFIEQPLPKENWDDSHWLKQRSPLPIFADEAFQTLKDLEKTATCFDGINIKLMKCGGISSAREIIERATAFDLKILLGCMSESSCGVAAAATLQSKAHWVDLDGPLLINNDPFAGVVYTNGKIEPNNKLGLGINSLFEQG